MPTAKEICAKKTLYVNEESAFKAAKHIAKQGAFMRVYQCDVCRGWHLTSQIEPLKEKGA